VYVRGESGTPAFHVLATPTFEEVQQVAAWTHARIARVLLAHGRSLDGLGVEPPGRDRKRLEHVLRYMARPPLALDRLEHSGAMARRSEATSTLVRARAATALPSAEVLRRALGSSIVARGGSAEEGLRARRAACAANALRAEIALAAVCEGCRAEDRRAVPAPVVVAAQAGVRS